MRRGGGGRPPSQDTAGPDCFARPCSWELDSRFALTGASWAVPLCWTLLFVTGCQLGAEQTQAALVGSDLAVEVGGIWWTRRVGRRWAPWRGAVRVQLAVTEEASLRATWLRVSKAVVCWGPCSKRQQA